MNDIEVYIYTDKEQILKYVCNHVKVFNETSSYVFYKDHAPLFLPLLSSVIKLFDHDNINVHLVSCNNGVLILKNNIVEVFFSFDS